MDAPEKSAVVRISESSIANLVCAFEAQTLPQAAWTHEAHVLVALWHVLGHPEPEATDRVRIGIQRLNAAHGVPTTPTRGYHETLTRFYMWAVRKYVEAQPKQEARQNSIAQLALGLLRHATRELPLQYYSRERVYSVEARFGWLPPDLQPLE